jgi:hypothetical protein
MQTDPVGYGPSPNLYAYVLGDPVNLIDPLGLEPCPANTVNIAPKPSFDPNDPNGPVEIHAPICVSWDSLFRTDPGFVFSSGRGSSATQPTRLPQEPQSRSHQCQPASGTVADYERNLANVATVLDAVATGAAFLGQEHVALTFELGAGTLIYLKYRSQTSRGDTTGAYVTATTFAASSLIGRINKFIPIGGKAQQKFNAGVASSLGLAYGHGLEAALGCK